MASLHFVSKSCEGERCVVCKKNKPATHKLGEEIPSDEPCTRCGSSWRRSDITTQPNDCKAFYHRGHSAPRHNLTAYVCCACFTHVLGAATGCPLTDNAETVEPRLTELERRITELENHPPGCTCTKCSD